ncbi:MAG: hypothetical protein ACYDCN_04705 [Bacteroidia bacterium]
MATKKRNFTFLIDGVEKAEIRGTTREGITSIALTYYRISVHAFVRYSNNPPELLYEFNVMFSDKGELIVESLPLFEELKQTIPDLDEERYAKRVKWIESIMGKIKEGIIKKLNE